MRDCRPALRAAAHPTDPLKPPLPPPTPSSERSLRTDKEAPDSRPPPPPRGVDDRTQWQAANMLHAGAKERSPPPKKQTKKHCHCSVGKGPPLKNIALFPRSWGEEEEGAAKQTIFGRSSRRGEGAETKKTGAIAPPPPRTSPPFFFPAKGRGRTGGSGGSGGGGDQTQGAGRGSGRGGSAKAPDGCSPFEASFSSLALTTFPLIDPSLVVKNPR